MHLRHRRLPIAGIPIAALLLSLTLAPTVAAHDGVSVGEYLVEVGWRVEPALVGQPNGIQVTIREHHDDAPVTDLGAEALTVMVATAGVNSPILPLTPAFDAEEGTGPLGEYGAVLVPTVPGDYTFNIVGAIHGTEVLLSIKSGEDTFNAVESSGELEFPIKQPTLAEVATRLDRIDGRIEEVQGSIPNPQVLADLETVVASAHAAATAAQGAATMGIGVGLLGLGFGIGAMGVALRARRGARSA
jgi:hypothetical protein